MPLSYLVTIVLRLFSVSWFVQGIISVTSTFESLPRYWPATSYVLVFLNPAIWLIFALILYLWSGPLGRMVTPRENPTVQISGLSLFDLYCFAFTFLGLYFALSSIANTINWIHHLYLSNRQTSDEEPQQVRALYGFTETLITFLAGGVCLLCAPRFARKLARLQRDKNVPAADSAKA